MASLIPAYMLLFWRDLVSTYNDVARRQDELALPVRMFPARPSLEWIGICLAVATGTTSIVLTAVARFHLPRQTARRLSLLAPRPPLSPPPRAPGRGPGRRVAPAPRP